MSSLYKSVNNLAELARKGGFKLNEGHSTTCDSIDWRFIASIDTSRIVKDSEFEKLDECISFLIKSSFGSLFSEVRILDPAIVKIYIISQLSIQYLLFCTKFLDKSVSTLRENIFNYQTKFVQNEELIQQHEHEIEKYKKKIKEVENRKIFSCSKCSEKFTTSTAIDAHILRHQQQETKELEKDSNLINTIKLELEVKKLKEKLNVTEKELMEVTMKTCEKCRENSKRKFENVGVQSNFEEKEKDDTEKEAIQEILHSQMRQFEEWRKIEEDRYREEIEELRSKFQTTIDEIKENAEKKLKNAPEPAPRLAPQTSSNLKSTNDDENVWKLRYKELEKMYQQQNEKMTLTVKGIEESYQDKMKKFEESMKKLETTKSSSSISTIPKRPESPKIIITKVQEISSSSDTDVEIVHEALKKSVKKIEEKPPKSPEKKTFSGQKFKLHEKKIKSQEKPKENPREIAEKLLHRRMKQMGMSLERETLSLKEFDKIQSNLVNQRDKIRKKHKNFFITRQKIQATVDSIFNRKQNQPKEPKQFEESHDADEDTSHVEDTLENITPENSLKTTQPIPKYRDELERVLMERMQNSNRPKEISEIVQVQPSEPIQPHKNKKVLFAVNSPIVEKKENVVNDEDSDFDISSFTSMELQK